MESATKQAVPIAINEIYDTYLRTISQFHFLTGNQLTRRLYKMGMRTTVMARLKLLTDAGYLHSFYLPTVKSKSQNIYTLATKGAKYLREEAGLAIDTTYKPSELAELSHAFLWHVLDLNSFLITAYLFERDHPAFHVQTMYHDLTLKKNPIEIPTTGKSGAPGKPRTVIPDAFLELRVSPGPGQRQRQYGIWVELDRGTEQTIEHFKQKIRNIIQAVVTNKAQEYFAITKLTAILFPTTAGEKRVEQMRKWTLEVMTEIHAPADLTQLFLFTSFIESTSPDTIFLTPIWLPAPKDQKPLSLFGA